MKYKCFVIARTYQGQKSFTNCTSNKV